MAPAVMFAASHGDLAAQVCAVDSSNYGQLVRFRHGWSLPSEEGRRTGVEARVAREVQYALGIVDDLGEISRQAEGLSAMPPSTLLDLRAVADSIAGWHAMEVSRSGSVWIVRLAFLTSHAGELQPDDTYPRLRGLRSLGCSLSALLGPNAWRASSGDRGALETLLVKVLTILEAGDAGWTREHTLEVILTLDPDSRRFVQGTVNRLRSGRGVAN